MVPGEKNYTERQNVSSPIFTNTSIALASLLIDAIIEATALPISRALQQAPTLRAVIHRLRPGPCLANAVPSQADLVPLPRTHLRSLLQHAQ